MGDTELGADPDSFYIGCEVELHGLNHASNLNGMFGTCAHWNAAGRWDVRLETGETVRARPENIRLRRPATPPSPEARSSSPEARSSEPLFEEHVLVRVFGLDQQAYLNHRHGRIIGPSATRGRWEVQLDGEDDSVSLAAENLSKLMVLPSNGGWQGKTVQSWVFADGQEDVDRKDGAYVVTLRVKQTDAGETLTCTSLAGEELAVLDSRLNEVTFAQVYRILADALGCDAHNVALVSTDGRVMRGLDHWTLAEARLG